MHKQAVQVFVDPTGRRRRATRLVVMGVAVLMVCFLSMLFVGALVGTL